MRRRYALRGERGMCGIEGILPELLSAVLKGRLKSPLRI